MPEKEFELLCNNIQELVLLHKDKDYKGKCFSIAFEVCTFLAERGNFTNLVHANIHIDDKVLGHAWIEYHNIVIDLTLDQDNWIQYRDEYYKFAKITQIIKYNFKEIKELVIKYNQKKIVWVDWIIYDT